MRLPNCSSREDCLRTSIEKQTIKTTSLSALHELNIVTQFTLVTNAGPLIYLAVLHRFDLLRQLFAQVSIPAAVYQEVVVQGTGLPGAEETRVGLDAGWLVRVHVQNRIAVDALLGELDLGEAEAITLARESGVNRVLLDDAAARARAKMMGLTVSGTIGVLILAQQHGLQIDLKQDLDALIGHNFRLSSDLYNTLIAASAKK